MKRRRGEGTDFHQMREYRIGDSLRQLDWKATACAQADLREYQDEKNQQLLLMLDSGRRMLASEGGLSHFDHALNASLVVATWRCARVMPPACTLPGRTPLGSTTARHGHGRAPLRASYDCSRARWPPTTWLRPPVVAAPCRRALVMLVSNVRDEDIEDLLAAVPAAAAPPGMRGQRARELDGALEGDVQTLEDATQAGAAALYLQQRAKAHEALRSEKVMVLDVTADALPGACWWSYLAVKREGFLSRA